MRIFDFYKCKNGVTAIEYCLLAAMFALVALTAFYYFRDQLADTYSNVSSAVSEPSN